MKSLKKLLLILLTASAICACAQEATKKKLNMKKRPLYKIFQLHKEKVNYKTMPQYFIEGYQSGCFYEIYVNGLLVFKHYRNVGLANHATPINNAILKSGTQTVTVKLFPLGKIGDKSYDTLTRKTRFDLQIFKRDKGTPWEGLDYDVVKTYFAPTVTGEETDPFKYPGAPMYEETFTFEAEVPYELKGWSESQILTNMDQELLEKDILRLYTEYGEALKKRNEEKWVDMIFQSVQEQIHSESYFDKQHIKRVVDEYKNTFDNDLLEIQPLDEYDIIFGGEGRVVALKSIERKGKSAFSFIKNADYNGEKIKVRRSRYLYLHKPYGSNQLEVIRQ